MQPYLSFNGSCAEAMSFYRKCFGGGELNAMLNRDSPMCDRSGPVMQDIVMHTQLQAGGIVIMASDVSSDHYTLPSPTMQVALSVPTAERAAEVFAALSDGAHVTMPIQPTFWTKAFGMLQDKFGVPWMVNSDEPAAPEASLERA